jgi:hypothetical protein
MRADNPGQGGNGNGNGDGGTPPPGGCDHLHNPFSAGCPWCR